MQRAESAAPFSLQARAIACRRGGRAVLRGVGFALAAGQVLVVRGPNGAGKSTLLRALAGLAAPSAGEVLWCGRPAGRGDDDLQRASSYLGHAHGLSAALSVRENLRFALALAGVRWSASACASALQRLDLSALADTPAGRLSQGQARRAALARVLLCARPLWLLDEPEAALDAAGEARWNACLAEHLEGGGLAVLATHRPLPPWSPARCQLLELGGAPASRDSTPEPDHGVAAC